LQNFQSIANENGGSRSMYDGGLYQSQQYILDILKLSAPNLLVTRNNFSLPQYETVEPSTLKQFTPKLNIFKPTTDFQDMQQFNGSVNITAPALDVSLGCNDTDFLNVNFTAGFIALIKRGTCTFSQKVLMALHYNASAVILYNNRNDGTFRGSFDFKLPFPVFFQLLKQWERQ